MVKSNKTRKNIKKSVVKRRTNIKHTRRNLINVIKKPSSASILKYTKGRLPLFQKQLPQQEFKNISNNSNVDCCPCVFNALGLGNVNIIKELQSKSNKNLGLGSSEISKQFNHPEYSFHFINNDAFNYNKIQFLRLIFKSLQNGYGTIGGWTVNNTRHCILFGKYNNKPLFVDAQQYKSKSALISEEKQLIIGLKNIEKHFNDKQNIYVLIATKNVDSDSDSDSDKGLIID